MDYQVNEEIEITLSDVVLSGNLRIPNGAESIIVFAHGSGSSRTSVRNIQVADVLNKSGFATLLFDLLTVDDDRSYSKRFDIDLLGERLIMATQWLQAKPDFDLNIGYFGASTGTAAALVAAAYFGPVIKSIVSRGGRPDLAMEYLSAVQAPTLLMVGSLDFQVIHLNRKALSQLGTNSELKIVEGASHLFEEPGKLEEVADCAADWYSNHFGHILV